MVTPQRCLIIAEAGVNHNGDLAMALDLIQAAKEAGADAVKFQSFRAERLVSADAPKATYQQQNDPTQETQYDMLKRLELSAEDHVALWSRCNDLGIEFLSTPFDEEMTDFLKSLGVRRLKSPSGELTNINYLQHLAATGLPLIMSTGMASMREVSQAVKAVQIAGCEDLTLLQCVSNYPAQAADVNLRAMLAMQKQFDVSVGYSDHVIGNEVALAAVALGATIVEKHFTLDRTLPGPDHAASILPESLKALVDGIRQVEAALGDGIKRPAASEKDVAKVARRSLHSRIDIAQGTKVLADMVEAKRPGTGMPPFDVVKITGLCANIDIPSGTLLTFDMFSP